jgi:nucleoside-diphosphate-sugar epimerase
MTLKAIASDTNLDVVIIRSPLVYGPGVAANFLRLIQMVDCGLPLPLKSIHNKRSMIYLGNLIDAIITCISHPGASGETFMVSDGYDISTPELIFMIASAMGKRPMLMPFPHNLLSLAGRIIRRKDEVDRLIRSLTLDSGKIRRVLEWRPPYTMEEGLRETISWYRSH